MIGVLRLDPHVFEEIERDPEATNQAFMIVVFSGVAGAIGNVRVDAAGIAAYLAIAIVISWILGADLTTGVSDARIT